MPEHATTQVADSGRLPVRTCIGCRQRAAAGDLLRVVVAPDPTGTAAGTGDEHPPARPVPLVPDPRRRMPGRGAWLHPTGKCVELAVRRRAFARALHVPAACDPAAVADYVASFSEVRQRNPAGDEEPMGTR